MLSYDSNFTLIGLGALLITLVISSVVLVVVIPDLFEITPLKELTNETLDRSDFNETQSICGDQICSENETCTLCEIDCGTCSFETPIDTPIEDEGNSPGDEPGETDNGSEPGAGSDVEESNLEIPLAIFSASTTTGTAPLTVSFDASDSFDPDGEITSFNWAFGDGSTGIGRNTVHTFSSSSGSPYTVTLVVTDNDDISSEPFSVQITLESPLQPEPPAEEEFFLMRGGYNSFSRSSDNLEKIKRQIEDGVQDILVKDLGFSSPPLQVTLDAIDMMYAKVEEYGGKSFWLVINYNAADERNWINREGLSYTSFVTSVGVELPNTPCITRDYFHEVQTSRLIELAKLSKQYPLMEGAILDMEMYTSDESGYHGVCYCTSCIQEFFDSKRIADVVPGPSERYNYLSQNGLGIEYEEFREEFLYKIAREAQQQIKAVNSDFKIAGMALLKPGERIYDGLARGLGTRQDPVIAFTEKYYRVGYKPSSLNPWLQQIEDAGIHAQVVLGLQISQIPPASMASHMYASRTGGTYGYWIYTGEHYYPDNSSLCYPFEFHRPSIVLANSEISNWVDFSAYQSSLVAKKFEDGCIDTSLLEVNSPLRPFETGEPFEGDVFLRRGAVFHFFANQGETIFFDLEDFSIGNDPGPGFWTLYSPSGIMMATDNLYAEETDLVRATAEQTGLYGLILNPGYPNKVLLKNRSHPGNFVGMTEGGLHLFKPNVPHYVFVPENETNFSATLNADSGEPIRVTIFDTRFPEELLFDQVISSQIETNFSLNLNPDGTVVQIDFSFVSGSEDVQIKINSPNFPFIAQSKAGLLKSQ